MIHFDWDNEMAGEYPDKVNPWVGRVDWKAGILETAKEVVRVIDEMRWGTNEPMAMEVLEALDSALGLYGIEVVLFDTGHDSHYFALRGRQNRRTDIKVASARGRGLTASVDGSFLKGLVGSHVDYIAYLKPKGGERQFWADVAFSDGMSLAESCYGEIPGCAEVKIRRIHKARVDGCDKGGEQSLCLKGVDDPPAEMMDELVVDTYCVYPATPQAVVAYMSHLAEGIARDANRSLRVEVGSGYDVAPHVRLIDIVDAIEEWTMKMFEAGHKTENETKDIVARVAAHVMRKKT